MPPLPVPGRTAPAAATLMIAAIGALLLGGGAIYVFYRGRAAVLAPDAARGSDRSLDVPDAPLGAGVAPDVAPPQDAAAPEAAPAG